MVIHTLTLRKRGGKGTTRRFIVLSALLDLLLYKAKFGGRFSGRETGGLSLAYTGGVDELAEGEAPIAGRDLPVLHV
ncbi:hypothetical protein LR090_05610, partial [Candidatus Bipolaricaulota bacterium]|nr:hypothetical protein [Candidatus Bipolaricaulota bacterium]